MQPGSAPSTGAGPRPSRRRQSREFALQILYQRDAGGEAVESVIASFWESQGVAQPDIRSFAEELVRGAERHRESIDQRIVATSEHWDPARMAAIDRTILRLAIFELLHRNDIPPKVSINEYIEIAKKFSTEDSGAFVNGILDRIWREHGTAAGAGSASARLPMGFATLLAGQQRQGTVFLLGTPDESAGLFGTPAPKIPPGDVDAAGVERIAVETSVRLGETFARWLGGAARGLLKGHAVMPGPGSPEEDAERAYLDVLQETLRKVAAADRRQGLANLFWLAHSREVSEQLDKQFSGPAAVSQVRYKVHPLLCGIMRRADDGSRSAAGRPQRALHDFRRGETWNDAIVRAVIDDQLALTETDPRTFDPSRVLVPGNSRFRIGAAAFAEILEILRTRLARACAGGDRGVLGLLQRVGGAPLPEHAAPAESWNRFVFADPVRQYLLHDLDGAVGLLLRSRTLRREITAERSWSELFEDFAEVTRCVRRAETVHLLRCALDFKTRSLDSQETRERYLEGRLFRFGPVETVQSGVRTTTILFADIRGFTRASEGAVSEGELARELYEIFDPAALIVQRFGGTIDKYLGDGFMATFTGGSRPGEEALAAVRAAISLQQVLGRMRLLGRTAFRIGISLHTGRVAVARFLIDEQHASTTIIGRQVNIAGRLSASEGDLAGARESPGARVVGDVAIDGAGHLVNQGIAVSGPLLAGLKLQVAFEPFRESGIEGVCWYDRDLSLWLHFGYVGEVRFRGLEAAIPIYSLGYSAPGKEAGS